MGAYIGEFAALPANSTLGIALAIFGIVSVVAERGPVVGVLAGITAPIFQHRSKGL